MTPKGNKNVSTSQGKQKLNRKQDDKSRRLPKQTLKTDSTSQRKQKLDGKQENQIKQKLNRKQEKSRRVTIDWTEKERKSYNEIPFVPNTKKRTTVEKSNEGVVQENKIEKSNLDNEINVAAEVEEGTNPTHLNVGHRLLRNAPRASRPYFRLGVSLVCAGLVLLFPLVRDPCRFRHLELRARKKSLPPPVLFQNHLQKANSAFSHGHGVTM
ncbi:hypothetical protein FRACYDRAFT_220594 [Fragilariopsis cylindrus CCMP1102]|uniref:Uncharacterized protein n=1 Tax=Fragilariopsis cylindrus CCMP1102 TaxID=635003 RepID=A0A1E7ET97_9STRA|nr:hypothetical protein FRACYDRAFT_220594 [Fragilariopsis cylindrus CCMP1102]|eukprot:OEU09248.1 hypothetical protein FRACYDRAFT_220594 [Fragilariopsis cylindrus CCMP1102]